LPKLFSNQREIKSSIESRDYFVKSRKGPWRLERQISFLFESPEMMRRDTAHRVDSVDNDGQKSFIVQAQLILYYRQFHRKPIRPTRRGSPFAVGERTPG